MVDALAYIYDILADPTNAYQFGIEEEEDEDGYEDDNDQGRSSVGGY